MSNDKLRRQIIYEAARLLVAGQESDYYRAKMRAGRRLAGGWVHPGDLPTDQEIRDEIQLLSRLGQDEDNGQDDVDRFAVYRSLLAPLETVRLNPHTHPEGDALYHSLQVFDLARQHRAYDEELQLAALLHDVGKAIDPRDHITAGLASLNGHITDRTRWLIEHHGDAQALREGTLGLRARKRLEAAEDFDDLMLLCDCDRQGRQQGIEVPDLDEALEQLRELARTGGWS